MARPRQPYVRKLFDPQDTEPFAIGRNSLEHFLNCQRCFYLAKRCGISRPGNMPLTLNLAVDALLKREYDAHRAAQTVPPLLRENHLDIVPFAHPDLPEWRDNFRGIRRLHQETNLLVFGAIDDLWGNRRPQPTVFVSDYKATSKGGQVSLDADWQMAYKRQVEVYQWLLRGQGLQVSDWAFFVYVNAHRDRPAFGGRLEFETSLLRYRGSDGWIEPALREVKACLMRDPADLPEASPTCTLCKYRAAARQWER